ncbi:MAG: Tex family protein [Oscillospiraceae bacterium]|nr:Tex family protein [Oscillospiraceae bacterium]
MNITQKIASELGLRTEQAESTIKLLDEGNTVPFISRYRKEVTGSLDDQVVRQLSERLEYLRGLEKRKEEVRASIESQGKLTEDISAALEAAEILTEVEDIYRPFKPHRKTRASVAREKGLEPLAQLIFAQEIKKNSGKSPEEFAADYINTEKGVSTPEEALAGAMDIIAEDVSDNAEFRKTVRALTFENAALSVCAVSDAAKALQEAAVYSMYFEYSEKLSKIPPHRLLAINRGENEGYLKVDFVIEEYIPLNYLIQKTVGEKSIFTETVEAAVKDSYSRLVAPAIERDIRSALFDEACEKAIVVFEENLKNLLLTPPLKGKTVLGFDPGYRTGCKLAVVDPIGRVLDTGVIYPTKPQERIEESEKAVLRLVSKHHIDTVAIGNGTASKESEIFISGVIKRNSLKVKYMMVSEAGASVYSASKLGAEEFPDYDVTLRSAVSIARRLQDPLAELVKIDPKSIGVGQYQHDMKPARLSEALGGVVESCVNSVGVDLNTASYSLLSYISGINAQSAKNIVKFREENGAFASRSQLLKVPRIGAKAYEQCAGFLRLPGAQNPLDNTGVHPESYDAAEKLLNNFGFTVNDLEGGISSMSLLCEKAGKKMLSEKLVIGLPTLNDIISELEKPGRDIRDDFAQPLLRDDVMDLNDLKEGMELVGTVRNVCDFGAFIDIGVHQDGLVHISQISDRYIRHPSEVLAVGNTVKVRVLSVDPQKKRIALTMKK